MTDANTSPSLLDCPDCKAYIETKGWGLLHAVASVGISHNMSTRQVVMSWLRTFHDSGHQRGEEADGA
jgi:hypothetical protein